MGFKLRSWKNKKVKNNDSAARKPEGIGTKLQKAYESKHLRRKKMKKNYLQKNFDYGYALKFHFLKKIIISRAIVRDMYILKVETYFCFVK